MEVRKFFQNFRVPVVAGGRYNVAGFDSRCSIRYKNPVENLFEVSTATG